MSADIRARSGGNRSRVPLARPADSDLACRDVDRVLGHFGGSGLPLPPVAWLAPSSELDSSESCLGNRWSSRNLYRQAAMTRNSSGGYELVKPAANGR
jgi:hypothetical protein